MSRTTKLLAALLVVCCTMLATAGTVSAGMFGNVLSGRSSATDTSAGVFYTNGFGAPLAGNVTSVDVFIQNSDTQDNAPFQLFQLRPTGTANSYDVINASVSITASGTNGSAANLSLGTTFALQQGDLIGHYGQGIPFTQNSLAPGAHNNQAIYFASPAAPVVGNTIALGTAPSFPLFANTRDYAYSFELKNVVETIGNGAGPGLSGPDSSSSLLVVMDNDPFTKSGILASWQFFNDAVAGNNLTPVLLRESGGSVDVIGVGATIVSTANGFQQHDFDLVAGTAQTLPGDLFGFYYGDSLGGNAGSVEYMSLTGPTIRLFTDANGINFGDSFASGSATFNLSRYYSINATTVVPEPTSIVFGLVGVMFVTILLRRRSRTVQA